MPNLQPKPSIGGQESAYSVVEEHGVPAWDSDTANKSKWWSGGDTYTGFYYSVVGQTIYIQYGKNASGWAGTRFFKQSYSIQNEVVNSDNSIDADIIFNTAYVRSYRTDYYISGVPLKTQIKINDQVIGEYTGVTGDTFSLNINPNPLTVHVHIAPTASSQNTILKCITIYTAGTFPNASYSAGWTFYNPLAPSYLPGQVRKDGSFKTVNVTGGYLKVRKNGQFENTPKDNIPEAGMANKGHTRVYKTDAFRQAKRYE